MSRLSQSLITAPAFSLIEVLVVATIIILLTTIGIASFSTANQGARDAKRKGDIESIRQAMVLYRAQNGTYPTADGTCADGFCDSISPLVGSYMSPPFPIDPESPTKKYLLHSPSGPNTEYFCLCADVADGKGNNGTSYCAAGSDWRTDGDYYCAMNP